MKIRMSTAYNIVGNNPADPVKDTQGLKKIPRDEVYTHHISPGNAKKENKTYTNIHYPQGSRSKIARD
jgi:hypothetical protein